MGSILTPLAHAAAEEAPGLLAKTFKSLESGMRRTSAGNDMADLLKNVYLPKYAQAREMLFKGAQAAPKANQLAPHELDSQARNIARQHTLGQNDYRGVALVKAAGNGVNPLQQLNEQQNLADHVHMFLKDTLPDKKVGGMRVGPQSQFKMNVASKYIFQQGERRLNPNRVDIKTNANYHIPTKTEQLVTKGMNTLALPAIVIPHIGTIFNMGLNSDMRDLAKGLASATFNKDGVKQSVADFGIFAGTVSHAYTAKFYGSRGFMAKVGGDKFGELVYNAIHQPGFNSMRDWQLAVGAATGKLSAERMGDQLIKSGGKDKVALYQLRKMGIAPADVLAKGGIDPDMMRKAIYNYVDNKLFLDNTMQRSFYSGASWYNRLGAMYHGYVSRQGALLYNTLKNEIVQGKSGLVGAAQAFGMLGIVFPTVGAGLKTMQMYGRGQFQEATPKEDFKKLTGQEGLSNMAKEWLEGYSHMAAFGIATDYGRAASRHMLANAMLGPIGNEGVNLIQDSAAAFMNIGSDKEWEKSTPLMRDIVEDTIPDNMGKLIAHQVLPTKKEEKNRGLGSHKLNKLKGLKLKGLKKLQ